MPALCQLLSGHFTCSVVLPGAARRRCCLLRADEEPRLGGAQGGQASWRSWAQNLGLRALSPFAPGRRGGGGSGILAVLSGPCPSWEHWRLAAAPSLTQDSKSLFMRLLVPIRLPNTGLSWGRGVGGRGEG